MILENIKFTPILDTLRLSKISDKEYFSEKYAYYVSNSRLTQINPAQEGSFQKFIDGLQAHRVFSTSFELGSVVHQIVLQPEYFEIAESITNKPTAKAGFIAEECISICNKRKCELSDEIILEACSIVDYYGGSPSEKQFTKLVNQITPYIETRKVYDKECTSNKSQIFLDSKQIYTANACINALQNNKKVQSLLHPEGIIEKPISENEQAILLDVEVDLPDLGKFIVRLKSKLDNYTIDKESGVITVNDIKTHGKILPEFNKSIIEYRYMREIAMYSYLLNLCAQKFYNLESPTWQGNFLVVSTIPDYYTKVFPMTKKLYKEGFNEFKYLLKLAAIALYFKDENKALEYAGNEIR